MPTVPAYRSVTQAAKREEHRIYHDNDRCFPGRDIPQHQRLEGDGGYRLCADCARLGALQVEPAGRSDA